mmetsp:Transcript_28568/g.69943  ORF Transcript_28568/g.69943 Transcript_28568/m.69943 type:complete len:273 (-) Transcript_28568:41-859(-)
MRPPVSYPGQSRYPSRAGPRLPRGTPPSPPGACSRLRRGSPLSPSPWRQQRRPAPPFHPRCSRSRAAHPPRHSRAAHPRGPPSSPAALFHPRGPRAARPPQRGIAISWRWWTLGPSRGPATSWQPRMAAEHSASVATASAWCPSPSHCSAPSMMLACRASLGPEASQGGEEAEEAEASRMDAAAVRRAAGSRKAMPCQVAAGAWEPWAGTPRTPPAAPAPTHSRGSLLQKEVAWGVDPRWAVNLRRGPRRMSRRVSRRVVNPPWNRGASSSA